MQDNLDRLPVAGAAEPLACGTAVKIEKI